MIGLSAGNRTKVDFQSLDLAKKRLTPILIYLGENDYIFNFEKTKCDLKQLFDSLELDYTILSEPGLGHFPLSETCFKSVSAFLHKLMV